MSPEETQLLKSLFDRVKSASSTPRDAEAETLISQAVRDQPASPYYLAQAVIVQEKGLEAAAAHIRQLEERIHQLESGNTVPQQAQQGGFLSSIFGGSQQQAPAPTQAPTYRNDTSGQTQGPWGRSNDAPQPTGPWTGQQPSAFGRTGGGGGGFLQGALGAAAGVAGGMLLANSLSGIFSNHVASTGWGSGLGGAGTGTAPVEETVINNYYGDDDKPQQDADNGGNDVQQASYDDDSNDDADFDSGDGDSFV
ncbi:DUF2076 domain-containing protein [Agrobacterium rubi]|uniref:DUF2076 family protein n=1 Tax=Agrobacterium rubi TaxID=28099 RepID=A0AAE7R967_9HYPH|nr:DUF2076 family protein [Agrobacterium rubi]NTE86994.1 DUF2076 family protein [Agrobacterium rubi]NTF02928.1 DUF2076 family protein [Agrobacterium rubi]NTF37172.1 DUF2076 family protein [Agrobacterium rubi]OCJ55251.1 ABC transporter substrate-binding protein [Agrobacterium rubi]QTF99598.1 DUF2076 family protein [Agrobacterium rubi]